MLPYLLTYFVFVAAQLFSGVCATVISDPAFLERRSRVSSEGLAKREDKAPESSENQKVSNSLNAPEQPENDDSIDVPKGPVKPIDADDAKLDPFFHAMAEVPEVVFAQGSEETERWLDEHSPSLGGAELERRWQNEAEEWAKCGVGILYFGLSNAGMVLKVFKLRKVAEVWEVVQELGGIKEDGKYVYMKLRGRAVNRTKGEKLFKLLIDIVGATLLNQWSG